MYYYASQGTYFAQSTEIVDDPMFEPITEDEYKAGVAALTAAAEETPEPEAEDQAAADRIAELENRVTELESENAELARSNITLQRNNAALLRRTGVNM